MSDSLVVLDASALINLLGCGSPAVILDALAGRCAIEEKTLAEILQDPFTNGPAGPSIGRLLSKSTLTVQRMSPTAYADYLELVSSPLETALGHGESAALAHADDVRATVVLDDRKARRIGKSRFPKCDQWTSVKLFRVAADLCGLPRNEIGSLIHFARENARMHILDFDQPWVDELPRFRTRPQPTGQGA